LQNAGVPTEIVRWDGVNHGFFFFVGIVDKSGAAMNQSCVWLRKLFAG
jgi:acetyl esterase